MIGRTSIIAAALTMGLLFASAASAQSHPAADSGSQGWASADSSLRRTPQLLAPMVISAEPNRPKTGVLAGIQARADIRALERENRALRRRIAQQGEEIDRLEVKLTGLREEESRMVTQIAGIDSATAATRAERKRLETRLRVMRERGGSVANGTGGAQ